MSDEYNDKSTAQVGVGDVCIFSVYNVSCGECGRSVSTQDFQNVSHAVEAADDAGYLVHEDSGTVLCPLCAADEGLTLGRKSAEERVADEEHVGEDSETLKGGEAQV